MLYFLNSAQIGCFRHVYPQSGPAVAVTPGVCDAGLVLSDGEPKQASPTTNFGEAKVIGVRATLRTIFVAVIGFISRNRGYRCQSNGAAASIFNLIANLNRLYAQVCNDISSLSRIRSSLSHLPQSQLQRHY